MAIFLSQPKAGLAHADGGKIDKIPYRGGFLYEFELRRVLCNFELISTSYEDGTLTINFFLRASKGSCSELIIGLSSLSAPS